jgi:hypothetical protein
MSKCLAKSLSISCSSKGDWALEPLKGPSGGFKKDFGEVNEAMVNGIERPCEIIFCILGIEKSDFYEVT